MTSQISTPLCGVCEEPLQGLCHPCSVCKKTCCEICVDRCEKGKHVVVCFKCSEANSAARGLLLVCSVCRNGRCAEHLQGVTQCEWKLDDCKNVICDTCGPNTCEICKRSFCRTHSTPHAQLAQNTVIVLCFACESSFLSKVQSKKDVKS